MKIKNMKTRVKMEGRKEVACCTQITWQTLFIPFCRTYMC